MVAYRIDGVSGTRTLSSGGQVTRTIADYVSQTRDAANEDQHPVAVFDADAQPVFRNSALAARLTAEYQSQASDRMWQLVYATACRAVADAMRDRTGVAAMVPVQQRVFVVLGSLLRQPTGTIYGATVHLAEVQGQTADSVGSGVGTEMQDEDYRTWMRRRDESRSRMQRLSPREAEVVNRVSAGLPNKSIARELEISVKTIEKHRANAVRKLGVASTPEMVRIAVLADADSTNPEAGPARGPAVATVPAPAANPHFSVMHRNPTLSSN